jgi:hypothetical protein
MIVEQIRYYVRDEDRDALLAVRRSITRLREARGLPAGYIFVADPVPDECPAVIWQCGYNDDTEMGMAEAQLLGNAEYEEARKRLSALVTRIELEIYASDEG